MNPEETSKLVAPATPRLLEGKVAIITGATLTIDGGKLAAGA
jgi:hypothetical protein